MSNRLAEICDAQADAVAAASALHPLEELKTVCAAKRSPRDFTAALKAKAASDCLAVISEAKRQSPSAGMIVSNYDPVACARGYEAAGAACLSVLTNTRYFGGSIEDLRATRAASALPVLRKDFIIDPWQVYETRVIGADCILLIAAILNKKTLVELAELGRSLGLAVLVEVHDKSEIPTALATGSDLIGVNNRNLETLDTDIEAGARLVAQLADSGRTIVAESAISNATDAARMLDAGATAILVGEALLRSDDVAGKLKELARPRNNGLKQD